MGALGIHSLGNWCDESGPKAFISGLGRSQKCPKLHLEEFVKAMLLQTFEDVGCTRVHTQ